MFALPYMSEVFAHKITRGKLGKNKVNFLSKKDLPRHVGEKITKIKKHKHSMTKNKSVSYPGP